MLDRLVEFPNRVRLIPVEGQSGVYDVVQVPGTVTEEGTPLNKGTLLSDVTGNRYGLDKYGTIDDAFNRNLDIKTITMPLSGWSTERDANGYLYQQINYAGMQSEFNPLASLKITSQENERNERASWAFIRAIETYDGYVIARAVNLPYSDITVELKGV